MLVGIDFGTTYSEIAALDYYQKVELLQDTGDAIPSVFCYTKDDTEEDTQEDGTSVGTDAISNGISDAGSMVLDVKMKLGEKFNLSGKEFSSEEIVRCIYKEIITIGQTYASTKGFDNTEIEGIVLSLPNRFTEPEKELLVRSARTCMGEAPLPVSGTIKEPVAAAIYYIEQNKDNPNEQMNVKEGDAVLVYDLGGGTCDVAIVKYNPGEKARFEVIDSDMIRKGGRDWDKKVSEELERQFDVHCQEKHRSVSKTLELMNNIRVCAETMKKDLSQIGKENVRGHVTYYYNNVSQKIRFQLTLSKFNELTEELLKETMDCLQRMYEKHHDQYNITNIICVGGGSKMKQVKETISARIPACECRYCDPQYAIVKGAALYADMLGKPEPQATAEPQSDSEEQPPRIAEENEDIISDIASFTYGIKCYYNFDSYPTYLCIRNLIIKNRKLPVSCDYRFMPAIDNSTRVTFSVFESDSEEDFCELDEPTARNIGMLEVNLPSEYQTSKTKIMTHIVLNRDQILEVTATLPDGTATSVTFDRSLK